jgi:hypothetical protein
LEANNILYKDNECEQKREEMSILEHIIETVKKDNIDKRIHRKKRKEKMLMDKEKMRKTEKEERKVKTNWTKEKNSLTKTINWEKDERDN